MMDMNILSKFIAMISVIFLDDYTECLLLKQSTGIKIRRYSESVKML